ncbi:MAG: hypothetical protein IPO21_16410 [Bacteroidales bacterium]|nr:hypothetical protein [Bacteroidales bacterium]
MQKTNRIIIFTLLIISLFSSCQNTNNNSNSSILARVDESILYIDDVAPYLNGRIGKDSADFIKIYIDKWITNKLVYQKALLNIDDNGEIEQKVTAYREALFINKYEQILSEQKIKTEIQESELQMYYNEHMTSFMLPEEIVKPIYVEIPKPIANIAEIKMWFRSSSQEEMDKIKDYSYKFSNAFYFDDKWVKLSNIIAETKISKIEAEQVLRYKNAFVKEDSLNYYLFKINKHLPKDSIAPYDFVKNEIKAIIINKNKKNW